MEKIIVPAGTTHYKIVEGEYLWFKHKGVDYRGNNLYEVTWPNGQKFESEINLKAGGREPIDIRKINRSQFSLEDEAADQRIANIKTENIKRILDTFETSGAINDVDLDDVITAYENLNAALQPFLASKQYSIFSIDVIYKLNTFLGFRDSRKRYGK